MAKSNLAVFAKDPQTAFAVATSAYPLSGPQSLADGLPTHTVSLLSAGPEGALVTSVYALARGTHTATQAALFIRKATDPAEQRTLLATVSMPAQSITTTTRVNRHDFDLASDGAPLRLAAGDALYFGIAVTQAPGILAHASYSDF